MGKSAERKTVEGGEAAGDTRSYVQQLLEKMQVEEDVEGGRSSSGGGKVLEGLPPRGGSTGDEHLVSGGGDMDSECGSLRTLGAAAGSDRWGPAGRGGASGYGGAEASGVDRTWCVHRTKSDRFVSNVKDEGLCWDISGVPRGFIEIPLNDLES